MFEFVNQLTQAFRPRNRFSVPIPAKSAEMELVSKEDVYSADGEILLVRKGSHVPLEAVSILIQYGVRPEQFYLSYLGEMVDFPEDPQDEQLKHFQSMSRPTVKRGLKKRILIYEPNDKDLDRLTQCLLKLGIPMNMIHPVKSDEHFQWALDKYQPQYLFLDVAVQGLRQLPALQHREGLKKVILTLDIPKKHPHLREQCGREIQQAGAAVLHKPITRFDVHELLDLETPLTPVLHAS